MNLIKAGLLALLLSSSVYASTPAVYIATSPDKTVVVTLLSTPCEGTKVAKLLDPQLASVLKAGKVSIPGKTVEACWGEKEGYIVIIMENGKIASLETSQFKPAEEI